jgi:hypothetical protein
MNIRSILDLRIPTRFSIETTLNLGLKTTVVIKKMVMKAQISKIGTSRITCNMLEKTAATPLRIGARKNAPDRDTSNAATGAQENRNRGIAKNSEIFHHPNKIWTAL